MKDEQKLVSFRLSVNTIDQIKIEAKKNNASLNSVVSNILKKYAQWDVHENEMNMVSLPKFILEEFVNQTKNDSIEKLVESFYDYMKEWILITQDDYDFESSINFLKFYMENFGFYTKYTIEKNQHSILIRHKLGMNWSILIDGLVRKIFNDFVSQKDYSISIRPSTCKISFILKKS